jgi:hypothetical protein
MASTALSEAEAGGATACCAWAKKSEVDRAAPNNMLDAKRLLIRFRIGAGDHCRYRLKFSFPTEPMKKRLSLANPNRMSQKVRGMFDFSRQV